MVIAAHSGDHAIYPDCREPFMQAMGEAMGQGTYANIRLAAPVHRHGQGRHRPPRRRTRASISRETWSCYKGGEIHCGVCGTCVERREAFLLAGLPDPTIYEQTPALPQLGTGPDTDIDHFLPHAYRICKSLEVENGHMLSKHPDKCRFPHGHTRKVEFVIEADELDENEMVCDFKIVKEAVGEWLDTFDHALCMNTADPAYQEFKGRYGDRVIGFENQDPTTELMARTIFDHAAQALAAYAARGDTRYRLAAGVRLVRVRVWETTSSWAEYEPIH